MTEEFSAILQEDAQIRGPVPESVSKFDNTRRKKPWEVFKKQANNDELAESAVQFDSFRDKCQGSSNGNSHSTSNGQGMPFNVGAKGEFEGYQPLKLNRSLYQQNLQRNQYNNSTNNGNGNGNSSNDSRGWKSKAEKDFKTLNKSDQNKSRSYQQGSQNKYGGQSQKNGYRKSENENNNSANVSQSAGGISQQSQQSNGSSSWSSSKNNNSSNNYQSTSASKKPRFVNNNINNNSNVSSSSNSNGSNAGNQNSKNFKTLGNKPDDRKLKRYEKYQPKQSRQDIQESASPDYTNDDSQSPSQRQTSPQDKYPKQKRQKICGSWVRVAEKQKLDRPPSYQDYLGKLTSVLDHKIPFSISKGYDEEEGDSVSDMIPGDLEDGEIELQEEKNNNNNNNDKSSVSNKGKGNSKNNQPYQQSKQGQQPRGFTGSNSHALKKDERYRENGQDYSNDEIDGGYGRKKKLKREESNGNQDGMKDEGTDEGDNGKDNNSITEPIQMLQRMDQFGNEIIKNGNNSQKITTQQDSFMSQYGKNKKSNSNSSSNGMNSNGNHMRESRNYKGNHGDNNNNSHRHHSYGDDNNHNHNGGQSSGAGGQHKREKRFDIENYRVDFEKNMIDHNVNITEGLKNLVKIQNQLYVQTNAKKEEMKEAAANAKKNNKLTTGGSKDDDDDDDLNQFEKFNDEYLKKQEQMLEEIAKRNKEKINQIKNASVSKDTQRDPEDSNGNTNGQKTNGKGLDANGEQIEEETVNPLEKLISEELERNRQDKQAQSYRLLELQKLHQTHNPVQVDPKLMQPQYQEPKQGQCSVTSQQLQIMAQSKCESGMSRKRPSKFSDIPLPPVPVHDTMAQLERLRQMTQFSSQGPAAFASFPKLTPMQALSGVPHVMPGINFQMNSFMPQPPPMPLPMPFQQNPNGMNSLAQLQQKLFVNTCKSFRQQISQQNQVIIPKKQTNNDMQSEITAPQSSLESTASTITAATTVSGITTPSAGVVSQTNSQEIPLPQTQQNPAVPTTLPFSISTSILPPSQDQQQQQEKQQQQQPSVVQLNSAAQSNPQSFQSSIPNQPQQENPFSAMDDFDKIEIPEAIKSKQKHMKPALYEKVVNDYIKMLKLAKDEQQKKDDGALQISKDPRRRAQMMQALSKEAQMSKIQEEISQNILKMEAESMQASIESPTLTIPNPQMDNQNSEQLLGFSLETEEMGQLGDNTKNNNSTVYNYKLFKGEKRMLSQEQNLLDKRQQRSLQEEADALHALHASKSQDQIGEIPMQEEDDHGNNVADLYKDDKEIRYFRDNLTMCCMRCGQNGHYARWCPQQPEDYTQCLFCMGNHSREYCNSFVCFKCYQVGHRIKDCAMDLSLDTARCRYCRKKGHTYRNCGVLQTEPPQNGYDQSSLQNVICMNCNEKGHINCFDSQTFLNYDGLYKLDKETLAKMA